MALTLTRALGPALPASALPSALALALSLPSALSLALTLSALALALALGLAATAAGTAASELGAREAGALYAPHPVATVTATGARCVVSCVHEYLLGSLHRDIS